VLEGALDMVHARALLALDPARQIEAAHRIAAKGLSVRDTEALVQELARGRPGAKRAAKRDRDLERLEEQVSASLGTTVEIRAAKKGSGKLLIHYSSLDHLEELLKRLR
jgi:ParB family transcriptional regulator, chromosome partitioning protein